VSLSQHCLSIGLCMKDAALRRVSTRSLRPQCYTAGGGRDPLDEVAALHAQFLTPKHLRKGKGGRQPAVSASCRMCYRTTET
jgi:hypothetical protein